jgi:hypothetical protein
MLPAFLIKETTVRKAGVGQVLGLEAPRGGALLLTLGITHAIDQESIDISIWGSADGTDWGTKALAVFPKKFYCGTYQTVIALSERPDVKFLRAKWAVSRWGKGDPKPLFSVYLHVEEMNPLGMSARN